MQFYFHANQSCFHKNGFALRLALKQRYKRTRKWPIATFVVVSVRKQPHQIDQNLMAKRPLYTNSFSSFSPTEESEAASKQVLAKSEQIRKFQEENKYLGQLVSLVKFKIASSFFSFFFRNSKRTR